MAKIVGTALAVALAVGALAAGAVLVWRLQRRQIPVGVVIVNGRIEGDEVVVGTKVPGRIISLLVKEGQGVEAGQQIAELSSEQIVAKVNEAAARTGSARSALKAAEATAVAVRDQLRRAQAARAAALARRVKTAKDAERAQQLLAAQVISQSQLDDAVAARDIAAADLRAAEDQVAAARGAVAAADSAVAYGSKQLQAAAAALDESRATFGDTQIQSPMRGVVTTKVAEEGEVLAPGAPIVVLVDLDRLYMKAYVPEPEIGRIKLGDPARIYVDAFPSRPFPATLKEISPQSEFTPKEVQTREERTKQVIAVKLYLDANPQHMLVPGMPADAVIRWKPDAPWINPLGR